MRFKEFVFKNTIRNKILYMAYFFSTLVTVMTFFTFAVFAFHPSLNGNLHMAVKTGMTVSAVIIYLFSFFYVLYSMDIFLQSRKKEFGLLLIQGMSPKQLRKMVFQENTIIGFFATVVGSIVGIFFSQLILWLSKVTMHVDLGFYFPTKAIVVTFVSFLLLFVLISFFIQFKIPKMDVQELLKSEDLGKGAVEASVLKSIAGVLLIGVGYAVALYVEGMQVVMAMVPVIVLVILGTKLLFNQVSVYVVNLLKKNENRFWKKTNMIVFSDLSFRMKDNARSFFLVAVITTVAFSAIGTLTGFKEMSLKGVNMDPYDFSYQVNADDETKGSQEITALKESFNKHNVEADEYVLNAVTMTGVDGRQDMNVKILSASDYNKVAKKIGEDEITVDSSKAISIKDKNAPDFTQGMGGEKATQLTLNNQELRIEEVEVNKVVYPSFGNLYVVADETYEAVAKDNQVSPFYAWLVTKGSYGEQLAVGKDFAEPNGIQFKVFMKQMITDSFAPVLFIGFFIGIIFFISAGSFLYFRLYSDMNVDIQKFKMVHKLGFSKKEMKKVVYQQVGILFFTPIIVSCIHGAVALTAMYALFSQGLQMTALYVLGAFIVIQIIYYLVARVFYFNKLYRSVLA
ncbi:ABC transporter permease [Vagococcus fluvialis]|uniref:ABC transporter permease n=2 Tax=Vagococcus fluvialis TaxID=2738 RepID=UPI0014333929|nr:ABC transporter permease [Vagococcus fluvialis]MBO0480261.1 ABC transporter permease [Vagococcus fluvialis]MBO0484956.1 ABC transporter permease [Vagococcus fluvialis]MDT2747019.1 ABC transporter permease [Vagococcus fluvialis]NKC60188.1 ABC transporter permease [Vagococcus fluvialis]NKD51035.1 ABC transporter permease [Vagococcus fluvialis]